MDANINISKILTKKKKKISISIKIEPELYKRLQDKLAKNDTTVTSFVTVLAEKYVSEK